ncbi:nucleotidyl transferase AbiEii/AbiGii toxin family protein [candidate division KSB1 bacterium]|nr:nucleotidyl transferase AbiEii/AbiGii toxin family protein [candidate division KSB1 bacterium]
MKDYLFQLVNEEKNPVQAKNKMREYLQVRILSALQRAGAMILLALHGGTALRLLYNLPRFSEDLDFTLEHQETRYDIRKYLSRIRNELTSEGYTVSLKLNTQKTVHSSFVQFENILYDSGLSPHRNEKLSIKLEIDTKPPQGCLLKTTIVRRYMPVQLQHHDKASMLAGKLNAILTREYTKGRDLYDLIWYLSDRSWPEPNLELLNNALSQKKSNGLFLTEKNWRGELRRKISDLQWSKVITDVRPFLEDEREITLLTRENMLDLLSGF